ncbi:putative phage associated protein [Neisseria animaloris]|uniref:DUF3310 domain-containing protein n=1 Tax=Neisseria animaloris TaxID=326522 RepID=UPI000A198B5A|nr:DUF3310 domain-containing protein [Neisseria animaloris]OSI06816.1 hypothetical protein BWD08_10670 [Neisseria animaloris]VEH86552.1 putative phage associated protein [Neisseria animaloris]
MKDNINPNHYRAQPVECIEFTQWLNFCLGNAFKYIWRYNQKNGLEDLKKAEWYLQRQISEEPIYSELDDDLWVKGAEQLHECDFNAHQASALLNIWACAFNDTGRELPAALRCVRELIHGYPDDAGGNEK